MKNTAKTLPAPNLLVDVAFDFRAGVVVALVALPLCLGIALASGANLISGLIAGIVGGLIVAPVSGSHTSVSGPAAGLTAIVAMQITKLGSFESFLLAVAFAGVLQIAMGIARAGALSAFFPSSVIKGLLAAIGVILILKQIPHVLGHDNDPEGEMSFEQPDHETTFSEIGAIFAEEIHYGAVAVGLISIAILVLWGRWKPLKNSIVPGPLVVVLLGVAINALFQQWGEPWLIDGSHLVDVPRAKSGWEVFQYRSTATDGGTFGLLTSPDFSKWNHSGIYVAAVTIAIVASLETLLNLEAVDKLDLQQRHSPPSRELVAQGCGNIVSGLIGGLPITSVVVRGSVNCASGARTKRSAIFHGALLLIAVAALPACLNMIPLASLAAILLVTGFKLASPRLFKQMWAEGPYQFIPFLITLVAIVRTDLLIGILIGLGVSVLFILNSNLRRPLRRTVETQVGGIVLHIQLANQVSFLNKAALQRALDEAQQGARILIDASETDFIDPDILSLIREFKDVTAPARGMKVSVRGFRKRFQMPDELAFAHHATRELKELMSPEQVLETLAEGNRRFCSNERIRRDYGHQIRATAQEQHPIAVVLSCIDSRVPVELIFDLGIGDIFSVRVAGNVLDDAAMGSIEFGVIEAGVRLVLVMGHTRCGAVTAAVHYHCHQAAPPDGCPHLETILAQIGDSMDPELCASQGSRDPSTVNDDLVDEIVEQNVQRTVRAVVGSSIAVRQEVEAGRVLVVGAIYDISSGQVRVLERIDGSLPSPPAKSDS